jgi:hypothetical protein
VARFTQEEGDAVDMLACVPRDLLSRAIEGETTEKNEKVRKYDSNDV